VPQSTLKKFCAAPSPTPRKKPKTPERRSTSNRLFVSKAFVNEGPRWKRLRPAPMGRAFRYQKRTAHLWVGVAEHHVAAAERHAANVAEQESNKGVRAPHAAFAKL